LLIGKLDGRIKFIENYKIQGLLTISINLGMKLIGAYTLKNQKAY